MTLPYWPKDLDVVEVPATVDRNVDGEIESKDTTLRIHAASDGYLTIRGARRGADISIDAGWLLRAIADGLTR